MLHPLTYTGGLVETNGHLLNLPGGHVLVDAPLGIHAWLEKQGVKVTALLLTHQHFDHVQDAAKVQKSHGCPVYAWSSFDRALTLETFFGAMTGSSFAVPEYQVDHVLEGKSSLEAGGLAWELLHVPGHSPDSVCFWQKEEKTLMSGDVLFRGSLGRCDFPGGSFTQLVTGIREKLWPLAEDAHVYPGHGPLTTIGLEKADNPFMQD